MKIELERLINSNNVKYNVLIPMINESFSGSTADTINIYIDIYSITKILYSNMVGSSYNDGVELGLYNGLTSCLINMASHYRNFFRTRYRVNSRIYFIYSTNTPYINNKFIQKYNSKFTYDFNSKKHITEYIKNNIEILRILVPYLPELYLIESDFETGVVIYDLMCREDINNKCGHLIISKDIYNFQLVNMKPQTVFIRTKPNDGSYYINRNNLLDMYFTERRVKTRSQIMSPDLFTVLLSLTSLKERNIDTLFNVSKAVRILENNIINNRILNGYNNDIKYLWDMIYEKDFPIGFTIFEFRFKAIDILFQHSVFVNTPECINIKESLVDKYDPETVKAINNEYFSTNPLDLNRL